MEFTIHITLDTTQDNIILIEEDSNGNRRQFSGPSAKNHEVLLSVADNDSIEWRCSEASWEIEFITSTAATFSPFSEAKFGNGLNEDLAASHPLTSPGIAAFEDPGPGLNAVDATSFAAVPGLDAEEVYTYKITVIPNGQTISPPKVVGLDPRLRMKRRSRTGL